MGFYIFRSNLFFRNVDYTEVALELKSQDFAEILEAELAELEFESFVSEGSTLKAYILTESYNEALLNPVLEQYSDEIENTSVNKIEHQNWNAVWESNYPPVKLDNELFIGATFHEIDKDCKYSISLEPNMSFGTGHHPTTEMMLRTMFELDLQNQLTLDFGCGSAILAIYASYRGAHGVGVEIDPYAAEAARDNLKLNNVSNFEIITGDISSFTTQPFDVILANINKNVIEECLSTFVSCAKSGTKLLCSGFLENDIKPLTEKLEKAGFEVKTVRQIGEWAMINTIFKA